MTTVNNFDQYFIMLLLFKQPTVTNTEIYNNICIHSQLIVDNLKY